MPQFADILDPRTTLARPDLAEQVLEGLVAAAAYRATQAMQCRVALADLHAVPEEDAERQGQLMFGEIFDVLDQADGWAWGRARRDGQVAYARLAALSPEVVTPTHRVSVLRAPVHAQPDAASPQIMTLSLNALITVEDRSRGFVRADRAGWIAESDLSDFTIFDADPASVAERFIGAPYEAGGRDSLGLDGSGLVEQALYACGRGCPLDQQAALGHPVAADALRRGDLVCWPDHIAMMTDPSSLLHADSHHGAVITETLVAALARLGEGPAYRRPSMLSS